MSYNLTSWQHLNAVSTTIMGIVLTLKPSLHEPQLPVEKSVTLVLSIVVERRR